MQLIDEANEEYVLPNDSLIQLYGVKSHSFKIVHRDESPYTDAHYPESQGAECDKNTSLGNVAKGLYQNGNRQHNLEDDSVRAVWKLTAVDPINSDEVLHILHYLCDQSARRVKEQLSIINSFKRKRSKFSVVDNSVSEDESLRMINEIFTIVDSCRLEREQLWNTQRKLFTRSSPASFSQNKELDADLATIINRYLYPSVERDALLSSEELVGVTSSCRTEANLASLESKALIEGLEWCVLHTRLWKTPSLSSQYECFIKGDTIFYEEVSLKVTKFSGLQKEIIRSLENALDAFLILASCHGLYNSEHYQLIESMKTFAILSFPQLVQTTQPLNSETMETETVNFSDSSSSLTESSVSEYSSCTWSEKNEHVKATKLGDEGFVADIRRFAVPSKFRVGLLLSAMSWVSRAVHLGNRVPILSPYLIHEQVFDLSASRNHLDSLLYSLKCDYYLISRLLCSGNLIFGFHKKSTKDPVKETAVLNCYLINLEIPPATSVEFEKDCAYKSMQSGPDNEVHVQLFSSPCLKFITWSPYGKSCLHQLLERTNNMKIYRTPASANILKIMRSLSHWVEPFRNATGSYFYRPKAINLWGATIRSLNELAHESLCYSKALLSTLEHIGLVLASDEGVDSDFCAGYDRLYCGKMLDTTNFQQVLRRVIQAVHQSIKDDGPWMESNTTIQNIRRTLRDHLQSISCCIPVDQIIAAETYAKSSCCDESCLSGQFRTSWDLISSSQLRKTWIAYLVSFRKGTIGDILDGEFGRGSYLGDQLRLKLKKTKKNGRRESVSLGKRMKVCRDREKYDYMEQRVRSLSFHDSTDFKGAGTSLLTLSKSPIPRNTVGKEKAKGNPRPERPVVETKGDNRSSDDRLISQIALICRGQISPHVQISQETDPENLLFEPKLAASFPKTQSSHVASNSGESFDVTGDDQGDSRGHSAESTISSNSARDSPIQKSTSDHMPVDLASFAFPNGLGLHSRQESSHTLEFVLTRADSARFFCVALFCYSRLPRPQLRSELLKTQGVHEKYLPKWLDSNESSYQDSYYAPEALIILSRFPIFRTMKTILAQILRVSFSLLNQRSTAIGHRQQLWPLELVRDHPFLQSLMSYLVTKIPAPPRGGVSLGFTIADAHLVVALPPPNQFPLLDVPTQLLFLCLDPENIILAFTALLCEYRVVLCSQYSAILTPIAETLKSLLFPMEWASSYIPLLPMSLSEMLLAPTPYLVGVNAGANEVANSVPEIEAILIDLDENSILMLIDDPLPRLPESLKRKLLKSLVKTAYCSSHEPLETVESYWPELHPTVVEEKESAFQNWAEEQLGAHQKSLSRENQCTPKKEPSSQERPSFGTNYHPVFCDEVVQQQMLLGVIWPRANMNMWTEKKPNHLVSKPDDSLELAKTKHIYALDSSILPREGDVNDGNWIKVWNDFEKLEFQWSSDGQKEVCSKGILGQIHSTRKQPPGDPKTIDEYESLLGFHAVPPVSIHCLRCFHGTRQTPQPNEGNTGFYVRKLHKLDSTTHLASGPWTTDSQRYFAVLPVERVEETTPDERFAPISAPKNASVVLKDYENHYAGAINSVLSSTVVAWEWESVDEKKEGARDRLASAPAKSFGEEFMGNVYSQDGMRYSFLKLLAALLLYYQKYVSYQKSGTGDTAGLVVHFDQERFIADHSGQIKNFVKQFFNTQPWEQFLRGLVPEDWHPSYMWGKYATSASKKAHGRSFFLQEVSNKSLVERNSSSKDGVPNTGSEAETVQDRIWDAESTITRTKEPSAKETNSVPRNSISRNREGMNMEWRPSDPSKFQSLLPYNVRFFNDAIATRMRRKHKFRTNRALIAMLPTPFYSSHEYKLKQHLVVEPLLVPLLWTSGIVKRSKGGIGLPERPEPSPRRRVERSWSATQDIFSKIFESSRQDSEIHTSPRTPTFGGHHSPERPTTNSTDVRTTSERISSLVLDRSITNNGSSVCFDNRTCTSNGMGSSPK